MKGIRNNHLMLLILALCAISVNAHDFYVDGIYYKYLTGNEVAVTFRGSSYYEYSKEYSGNIVIPETVNYNGMTYSVTSIGPRSFWECNTVTSIEISNSITSIDSLAMYKCSGLKSITIPSSITSINYGVFYLCTGLQSVIIDNSVTTIGDYSFFRCNGLTYIDIPNSVTSIGAMAFGICENLTTVNIGNSVTSIGSSAFQECYKLTNVIIGNSVASIDARAFYLCRNIKDLVWNAKSCNTNGDMPTSSIEHVTIGPNVEVIPSSFISGSRITEVSIPHSVNTISQKAFSGCSELTNISMSNSVKVIGDSAFMNCSSLTTAPIPNTVTTIGVDAFRGCSGLTGELIIPNQVTEIGPGAFYSCSGLTSITIPNSIMAINSSMFGNCSSLANIFLPNSVTTIGYGAFKGCTSLASINVPNSVTTIGNAAFYQCYGLTSATIGNSVTSIGSEAFRYCNSLTTLSVGNSVSSIGYGAFNSCTSLTSVNISDIAAWCNIDFSYAWANPLEYAHHLYLNGDEIIDLIIPNTVTKIKGHAFYGCSGLTSVTVPNSVTSIGEEAFSGCSSLTIVNISDIAAWCNIDFDGFLSNPLYYAHHLYSNGAEVTDLVIPNSVTRIGNYAFEYCNYLESISIPNSITTIGNYAFQHINFLKSVTIPNSVTHIGISAFDHCIGLKNVTIPNSVTYIGNNAFNYCYSISTLFITGAGEWLAGALDCTPYYLYIDSRITSIKGIKINPKTYVYCYAIIPPECDDNSFTNYSGTLHVPAASLAAYFTAPYWSNFANIVGDAIEPNISISQDSVEVNLGDQIRLTANVSPANATPNNVTWISTNTNIATVNNGKVIAVGVGECDIIAECLSQAICHVLVKDTTVTITLSQHEAMLLPNHMIYITLIPNPIVPELSVISSDPSVAAARVVNNTVQVVGIKEGTTTITVGSVDGTAIPATCIVTVYTEPGDLNCDGFVNISDVTSLIDYLLSGDDSQISTKNANVNGDESINISDVTELIDYLLNGGFWPWEYETFNANGVKFTMVRVKGGTFMMGATSEQGNDALENEYPIHQVTLSDYMIGQTEVTQQLWVAVMGSNPSRFGGHMDRPVENVSWEQCQSFIRKLNQLTGMTFRLPTEAEWEYAARGGNRSSGYKYSGSNDFDEVAWCDVSGSDWLNPKYGTHTAASLKPNELRLYDMSGNVFEWCQDKYGTYSAEDQINPTGAESGAGVWRGGAWDASASRSRVSSRQSNFASFYVGLRLAL